MADRGGVLPASVDEEDADGVAAGLLCEVGGVGDEEAVFGRGGELGDDADVAELRRPGLAGFEVEEPQRDLIPDGELVVLDGFRGDLDSVASSAVDLPSLLSSTTKSVSPRRRLRRVSSQTGRCAPPFPLASPYG